MFKKKIAAMSQFGGTVSPKPGFSLNNVFRRSILLEGIIGGKTFGTKLLDNKNFNSTWLNQVDKIILTASESAWQPVMRSLLELNYRLVSTKGHAFPGVPFRAVTHNTC